MRRRLIITGAAAALPVAAGLALCLPTAAAAKRTDPAVRSDRAESYRNMACTVGKRPAVAERYLGTTSAADRAAFATKLVSGVSGCMFAAMPAACRSGSCSVQRQISYGPGIGSGMAAEALLAKMVLVSLNPLPVPVDTQSPWATASGREVGVDDMADCVAAIDPIGISSLLATALDSAAENEAIGALGVSLTQCLRAPTTLRANPASLRAALAEALYHRVAAERSMLVAEKK